MISENENKHAAIQFFEICQTCPIYNKLKKKLAIDKIIK